MGDVKFLKKIGQGAFGTVYLGDRNGSRVAIKVIALTGTNPKIIQDAFKEGKLLEVLQHPNIVRCQGFQCLKKGEITELHIVMEYCGGGDLHSTIRRTKTKGQYFSEEKVIGWFVDVTRALEYLHSKGVIHRDVKPLNILLQDDGTIKLGDFGLAKILRTKKDIQASVMGTVIYASPELHFRSICDRKSDMWSLGCTLYELVRLEPAFRSASELLKFVQKGMVLRPIPAVFSERIKQIITSLLRVDPNERPSASSVIESLRNIQSKASKDKMGAGEEKNAENERRKEGKAEKWDSVKGGRRVICIEDNKDMTDEDNVGFLGVREDARKKSNDEKEANNRKGNQMKEEMHIKCKKEHEKDKNGDEFAKGRVVNEISKNREENPGRKQNQKLQGGRSINPKFSNGDGHVDININGDQNGKKAGCLLDTDNQREKGRNEIERKVVRVRQKSPSHIPNFDEPRFPNWKQRQVQQINVIRIIGLPSVKPLRIPNGNQR